MLLGVPPLCLRALMGDSILEDLGLLKGGGLPICSARTEEGDRKAIRGPF